MAENWITIGEPLGAGGQGIVHRVRKKDVPNLAESLFNLLHPSATTVILPQDKKTETLKKLEEVLANLRNFQYEDGAKKQLLEPDAESISRLALEARVYESKQRPTDTNEFKLRSFSTCADSSDAVGFVLFSAPALQFRSSGNARA